MQKRKDAKPTAPEVGIIYRVGEKLLIDSTPLAQAGRFKGFWKGQAMHLLRGPSRERG
jgi:hypothetical protein